MRPENLFPEGSDTVDVGGVEVRKGSIAAFIYNALTVDRAEPGSGDYESAAEGIRELTPALCAVRVFDVFTLRSERVARIVDAVSPGVTPE